MASLSQAPGPPFESGSLVVAMLSKLAVWRAKVSLYRKLPPVQGHGSRCQKRLHKELMEFLKSPTEGISIDDSTLTGSDMSTWIIKLSGPADTLYSGEEFLLRFKFCSKYPFDSPEVIFIGEHIPIHPHIYSNGHICLSILSTDWSPALSVQAVCLSIVSMLSSAKEKKRPPDDSLYVRTCKKNPKKTTWWYHDEDV